MENHHQQREEKVVVYRTSGKVMRVWVIDDNGGDAVTLVIGLSWLLAKKHGGFAV